MMSRIVRITSFTLETSDLDVSLQIFFAAAQASLIFAGNPECVGLMHRENFLPESKLWRIRS